MSRALPGDIVQRRKGMVMHTGLVLRDGRVLHNTPGGGEHITSLVEFANGHRVRVRRRDYDQRGRALDGADQLLRNPRRYSLLTNNCEHTAYRASEGRSRSPQLAGWLLTAGVAGVTLLATRSPALAGGAAALVSRWRARR